MQEYYNVKKFTDSIPEEQKIASILNAVTNAMNQEHHLPRFMLILIDKDIIEDRCLCTRCGTGYQRGSRLAGAPDFDTNKKEKGLTS